MRRKKLDPSPAVYIFTVQMFGVNNCKNKYIYIYFFFQQGCTELIRSDS